MYCPVCWLLDLKKVEMERRQTSGGQDYFLCPICHEASDSFLNPGEKSLWCFECGQTTVHKDLKCKACGKERREK